MKNIFLLITGLAISILSGAQKIQTGNEFTISQPVKHDIYLTGGTVTVNAPIYGDLVICAGTVTLNDTVTGDITLAGGKVIINGYVQGDVRGIGGDLYLNGTIMEDLAISAGKITSGDSAHINGDAFLFAGTAVIRGIIQGNLSCRAGDMKFYGKAMQNLDCRCSTMLIDGTIKGKSTLAAQEISIGNQAAFYQDVSYWQKNNSLNFKNSVKEGKVSYDPSLEIATGKWQYVGFVSALFMIWYFAAAFVFIILIQYFFKNIMKRAADEAFNNTGRAIGRGFLFLISVPAAAFILMVTLIGLPLGMLALFVYFILILLGGIISSVIIANWISNRRKSNWKTGLLSLVALIIFMMLKFITLIPVFGWIITLVIRCLVFGSLIAEIYNRREKNTEFQYKL